MACNNWPINDINDDEPDSTKPAKTVLILAERRSNDNDDDEDDVEDDPTFNRRYSVTT
jgi:hypothetical protein